MRLSLPFSGRTWRRGDGLPAPDDVTRSSDGNGPLFDEALLAQLRRLTLLSRRTIAEGLAVLRTPARVEALAASTLLASMAQAVLSCVRQRRPGALVLVGGETAHAVLRALGQARIRVVAGLAPLVVGGELLGGPLAETPLVTKAGSAGDAETLVRALAWTREVAR